MALDRWVETGVAPDKIIASHLTNKVADRTLPLCPYPQAAVYNGSGDVKVRRKLSLRSRTISGGVSRIFRA